MGDRGPGRPGPVPGPRLLGTRRPRGRLGAGRGAARGRAGAGVSLPGPCLPRVGRGLPCGEEAAMAGAGRGVGWGGGPRGVGVRARRSAPRSGGGSPRPWRGGRSGRGAAELDDPHGLVAVAVAARVGGCLVERPQAVDLPPERHSRSLPAIGRWEPGPRPGPAVCARIVAGLSTRACTTRGSSRGPSGRSSGRRPAPARARTRRGRTGSARSSPSGTARGTDRSRAVVR